jgi:hypothetical protein
MTIISPTTPATATVYNTISGENRTVPPSQADHMVRNSRGEWSYAKPLPAGWDLEIPKYRASKNLRPSPKARHRLETPFTSIQENDVAQYLEQPLKAGETIETTSWPYPTMQPLNDSAKAVREFFTSRQKSRLPLKPWRDGRLYLNDGLSGALPSVNVLRPPVSEPPMPQPVRVTR